MTAKENEYGQAYPKYDGITISEYPDLKEWAEKLINDSVVSNLGILEKIDLPTIKDPSPDTPKELQEKFIQEQKLLRELARKKNRKKGFRNIARIESRLQDATLLYTWPIEKLVEFIRDFKFSTHFDPDNVYNMMVCLKIERDSPFLTDPSLSRGAFNDENLADFEQKRALFKGAIAEFSFNNGNYLPTEFIFQVQRAVFQQSAECCDYYGPTYALLDELTWNERYNPCQVMASTIMALQNEKYTGLIKDIIEKEQKKFMEDMMKDKDPEMVKQQALCIKHRMLFNSCLNQEEGKEGKLIEGETPVAQVLKGFGKEEAEMPKTDDPIINSFDELIKYIDKNFVKESAIAIG